MYNILQHAHSGTRWLVLLFLVLAIITAFQAWKGGKSEMKKGPAMIALIVTHIQLLLGIILYFISPFVQFGADTMKVTLTRFYTVEHALVMLIAVILITIGYRKSKGKAEVSARGKTLFTYYLIGLVLILISIPWPFRQLGGNWF